MKNNHTYNYQKMIKKNIFILVIFLFCLLLITCGKKNDVEKITAKDTSKTIQTKDTIQQNKPIEQKQDHSDFKIFWADFKKAVNAGDKEGVLKMTTIPFEDRYQDVYNKAKSLTSKSPQKFLENYDKIFNNDVINTINLDLYRGYSKEIADDENGPGQDIIDKDDYLLMVQSKGGEPLLSMGLVFVKKDGKYKLAYIPYVE